jgi:tRNA threonylcarbamoyladenosine biosynthesis protein TsaB
MSTGLTLALDGATYAGSVAVLRDAIVVASRELENVATPGKSGREELFLPMVAACLDDANAAPSDLDRVICGAGPGSFTSLRVAASIAKGIAVGGGCPLYGVSSLMLIVAGSQPATGRYLPILPAMRGEVFAQHFQAAENGEVVELGPPMIVAEGGVEEEAHRSGAIVIAGRVPHARSVAALLASIIAAGPKDINTWEPQYGRLAEAQVRWEAAHGRPLTTAG